MTNATQLGLQVGKWTIDPVHSNVEFSVRHMMVSKVRGRFNTFSGDVNVNEDITKSHVDASIDISSIDTRDQNRDAHLKSADFFDIENYPTATFTSTEITKSGDNYAVKGDLTIKNTTKNITLDVEFNGAGPDPYGGIRSGLTATTKISRKEFGLTWNAMLETGGAVVGDEVTIHLEIELTKAQKD